MSASAHWSRWSSGRHRALQKPSISRSPNQPSAQAIHGTLWRRRTGSKFPTSKTNCQLSRFHLSNECRQRIQHLSSQNRLARLSVGTGATPRPRRSLSQVPSQGPRSRILNRGPRPQIPRQSRIHLARRPLWMSSRVGQTRSIASSKHCTYRPAARPRRLLRSGCRASARCARGAGNPFCRGRAVRRHPLSLDSAPGGIIPKNHADEPSDGIA